MSGLVADRVLHEGAACGCLLDECLPRAFVDMCSCMLVVGTRGLWFEGWRMRNLIPTGASVTVLDRKLVDLRSSDLPDDWYREAVRVLRGGDGGEHGRLLYKVVASLARRERPIVVVDVGTARGFSALTMGRAIVDAGIVGTVYTIDLVGEEPRDWHSKKHEGGDPLADVVVCRSAIWRKWFGDEQEVVSSITGRSSDLLARWEDRPVDVAFLDGSHAYDDVKTELALLDSLMAHPDGVIVLDDYHLGVRVAGVRSRVVNLVSWAIGNIAGMVWSKVRDVSPRLGVGNEYVLVKQSFHGIRKAVDEFVQGAEGRWSLEIIAMPSRGDYQGSDYSLAMLSRSSNRQTHGEEAE